MDFLLASTLLIIGWAMVIVPPLYFDDPPLLPGVQGTMHVTMTGSAALALCLLLVIPWGARGDWALRVRDTVVLLTAALILWVAFLLARGTLFGGQASVHLALVPLAVAAVALTVSQPNKR